MSSCDGEKKTFENRSAFGRIIHKNIVVFFDSTVAAGPDFWLHLVDARALPQGELGWFINFSQS